MKKRSIVFAAFMSLAMMSGVAADGIWGRTDNTDMANPASWTNAANWVGGTIADGVGSEATFTNAYPNKAYRAVEIPPEGTTLGRFWFKNHDGTAWDGAFLKVYGGPMIMEKSGGEVPRIDSTSDQLHIYSSIQGTNGLNTAANWSVNLFGKNSYTGLTTVEAGYWITRFGGVVETSDDSIYNFASTNDYNLTGGRITFYGRKATTATITSNWTLVEGSVKATYVSGLSAGSLTSGSVVSAPGLPEGTFVKQITDASHILLSSPSQTNASSHALGFSPVDSKCYQSINSVAALHNNSTIMLNKNGANEMRVDVSELTGSANVLQRVSGGQESGVLALHDTRSYGGMYTLENAWLELPKDGSQEPVLSNVYVSAASTLSVPDADAVAYIPLLAGESSLTKTGAGRLKMDIVAGSALEVIAEQGSVEISAPLLQNLSLHLDASQPDTLTYDASGNVACWADADGRANGVTNSNAAKRPSVSATALNGLPVVDFGPYQSGASGDALFLENRMVDVWSIFVVYYGRHPEAVILGEAPGIGSCAYSRSANPDSYMWGPNTSPVVKLASNGLDGVDVDGTTTVLSTNEFHLVSVSQTGATTVGALGNDRDYRSGGQMIAEVLLYDRKLSVSEQRQVEAYLREKWFGVTAPYKQLERLELKDGTRLVLPDEGTLTVGALVTSGDVVLEGPGKLRVNGSVVQSGTITLENGGGLEAAGVGGLVVAPQSSVATNPVFWVDACTLTNAGAPYVSEESGTYYVSRWDDVRGAGYNYATNVSRRPTLRLNDVNGLPSVYFHRNTSLPSEGETMFWDVPLDEIRAVFMVVGSQEGGGILLGSSAAENTTDFYRGAWSDYNRPILSSSSSSYLRNGSFYINGSAVDPVNTDYNGYFQLIEAHPTGPVRASAFAGDRFPNVANGNGCQRIAEMILYTRELSDQERLDTAEYLMQKWLNRPVPYETSCSQVNELASAEPFEVALVKPNDCLDVARLTAGGGMVKSGEGTVILRSADLTGQLLDVQGGRVILHAGDLSSRVPHDAWMHVDASQTNTITYSVVNGTNMVTKWEHADGGSTWAQIRTTATRPPPLLVTNALNGLPVIDFREYLTPAPTTEQCFLEFSEACADIREVIMVFGSEYGGNTLLGTKNGSYRHFSRTKDNYTAPILSSSAASLYLIKGETRKNGEFVNPVTTGLSGSYDVISFSTTVGGVYSDAFANDAYASCGGQQLGEVLIFDRTLSLGERLDTEAYLMQKWKGITLPGYEPTAVGALAVAANAVVEVIGDLPVSGLSGNGTVEGDLTLGDGAIISVSADNGDISGLTVSGEVTLLGGGTVEVSGDTASLFTGEYTILSCGTLLGAELLESDWSVSGMPSAYQATLRAVADTIVMRISLRGTLIIVL